MNTYATKLAAFGVALLVNVALLGSVALLFDGRALAADQMQVLTGVAAQTDTAAA